MEIIGTIKRSLFEQNYASKEFPYKTFTKYKVLIKSGHDEYYIEVPKSKIDILKYCKNTHLIKFSITNKTTSYLKEGVYRSTENYILNDIDILQTIKTDKHPITIKDKKYVLKVTPYQNGALALSLLDLESEEFIDITHYYQFPDSNLNVNHAYIKASHYELFFNSLHFKGVIDKGKYIKTIEGKEGYICKVLVRHLLNHNSFLPIYNLNPFDYSKIRKYNYFFDSIDKVDYSNFNDDLDLDQQNDSFWNQF